MTTIYVRAKIPPMSKKICIIGLGLIGGSLGMAIKKKKLAKVIGLTRKASKIRLARRKKAIDLGFTNPKDAVKDADIIFICYPIHLIIPELKKIIKYVKPGAIITDVGSTKGEIVKKAEKIVLGKANFIGGHPMCGKETTGLEAADPAIFKGSKYILTKTNKTDIKRLKVLSAFVKKIGVKPLILSPDVHDGAVAGISHSLIAVAASLVNVVSKSGKIKGLMSQLASSGFRDTTRIASGDPSLAIDMFTTNKRSVLKSLKFFKSSLSKVEGSIKAGRTSSLKKELVNAKKLRDSIYK